MSLKPIKLKGLILYVVLTFAFGIVGSVLGGDTGEIYKGLIKPPFSPPGAVFPVVWSILYALMGTGAYILSNELRGSSSKLMKIYWLQLALNALWPLVFWRLEMYFLAAILIAVILVLVLILTFAASKVSRISALLFVPYIIWLVFALYLNVGIAILN